MSLRELRWGAAQTTLSPEWTVGIGLLILTKMTDLVTTILGLTVVDGLAEKNPVGAWVYSQIGIVGLVGSSVVGVLLVILVVEWTRSWLSSRNDCSLTRRHLSLMSYYPLSVVYALATVHNSSLLLRQLG